MAGLHIVKRRASAVNSAGRSVQAARFVQSLWTRGRRLPPGAVAASGARNRV